MTEVVFKKMHHQIINMFILLLKWDTAYTIKNKICIYEEGTIVLFRFFQLQGSD